MSSLLLVAFVFLVAGVIAVPVAARLGLGSVLGYLIAGIVISPMLYAMHIDVIAIRHIAEFGVVMMLFLVGLELEPRRLWEMRGRLVGLGGLQVVATTGLIACVAMMFGLYWSIAVAIGLVLCLSSTAIVLQTLDEKGLMKSDGGQAGFSVLLFQDIAVILMLALIPLLANPELMDATNLVAGHVMAGPGGGEDGHGGSLSLVENISGWQQTLVTIGAVGLVVLGGYFLVRPVFRYIAMTKLREIFIAAALLIVVAIALLMTLVGLSPALGTFLAGVVLATSEFRHELESDVEPFKGLLLGLFFMTVGASIDFNLLANAFFPIIGITLGLMALKGLVLLALSYLYNIEGSSRWLFSLSLAQAGEFGFVLLSLTVASDVIPESVADRLLLIVALSMLLTPVLFIVFDKIIAPRYTSPSSTTEADDIHETAGVIVAGIGRFGSVVNRILTSSGYPTVVVDYSASHLETVRKFGIQAFYGDASRPELLHAAGIQNAQMLVVAIDGKTQISELVKYVHTAYPDVHIVARAVDRAHVHELYALGAHDIIRETFDSATRGGRSALEALGESFSDAQAKIDKFVALDRFLLREVAEAYKPGVPLSENPEYVEKVKKLMPWQEAVMQGTKDLDEMLSAAESAVSSSADESQTARNRS